MKMLFVCSCNINRSPSCDIIMRKIIADNNLDWIVDSCATSDCHVGFPPATETQTIAKKYGYDISTLRARHITKDDLIKFDIIFAMNKEHYNDLLNMGVDTKKLKMLFEITPEFGIEVPAYSEGNQDEVFNMCMVACNKWFEKLNLNI